MTKKTTRPSKKVEKATASLLEFVKSERRKDCPICQLPTEVLKQLQEAPDKGIKVDIRVKWLNAALCADVTADDLAKHMNARHGYE